MVVVTINYRRPEMPKAEWEARYTDERATQFLGVPGLLWKIWLDGEEERMAGGTYLFADRASAEAYVNGPIVARLKANPELSEQQIRIFDVRERMSAITRAPLPDLKLAAEEGRGRTGIAASDGREPWRRHAPPGSRAVHRS